MIPTIEEIVAGLLDGRYGREQAIGWLHSHAEAHFPDEDRVMIAATIMGGLCADHTNGLNDDDLAFVAIARTNALLKRLKGGTSP
jgi:hypothetical protein